jgi:hypothetical protein
VVTGKTVLLRAQRRWADARGVRYDAHGCVRELADNFHLPLAAATRGELERGSELTPYATRPARLYSLGSSAALVLNVFGYWRDRAARPLLRALGIAGAESARLTFEEPLPTGLAGDAPTADVASSRSRASTPNGWCGGRAASACSRTSISRRGAAFGPRRGCRCARRSPTTFRPAASGQSTCMRHSC